MGMYGTFMQICKRKIGFITLVSAVIIIPAAVIIPMSIPWYEAKATILVYNPFPAQSPFEATGEQYRMAQPLFYRDYFATQETLITSDMVLRKAVNDIGFKSNAGLSESQRIKMLGKAVSVNQVANSMLYEIGARADSPDAAALIANTVAESYIDEKNRINQITFSGAIEWLSKKVEEEKQKLTDAELALQKYTSDNRTTIIPGREILGKTFTLDSGLENVQFEYAKLNAEYEMNKTRYTDTNPRMVELKSQIEAMKNKIYGMGDMGDTGKSDFMTLWDNLQATRVTHASLLAYLKEFELRGSANIANAIIVDKASPPLKPSFSKILILILLSLLGGVGSAVSLAIITEPTPKQKAH